MVSVNKVGRAVEGPNFLKIGGADTPSFLGSQRSTDDPDILTEEVCVRGSHVGRPCGLWCTVLMHKELRPCCVASEDPLSVTVCSVPDGFVFRVVAPQDTSTRSWCLLTLP